MNLIYSGDVQITFNHTILHKHNHGTINLFKLFSTIMSRETFNPFSLPTYMMIYKASANDLITNPYNKDFTQILNEFVDINSYSIEETGPDGLPIFKAVFDAVIPYSYKNSVAVSGSDKLALALVGGDKETILASIEFSHDSYAFIASGSSAVIKWTMCLKNEEAN